MNKTYRLCEVEEVISDMDLSEVADDIVEVDYDTQLVISGWYDYLPELNLRLHEGVVGYWEEELQAYMPDFSVTVVFEGEPENTEYLFFEQDGMVLTMANWLKGRMSIDAIEQLRCEIVIPRESND